MSDKMGSTPMRPDLLPTAMQAPKFHDVTIVIREDRSRACVEGVPPEEFGISRHARTIKDATYCFHEVSRTQGNLIAEGFDADQIRNLTAMNSGITIEAIARDTVDEHVGKGAGDESLNDAGRLIRITEHYVRMDYEGDGKVRLYRITTGGNEGDILRRNGKDDIEEVDEAPFSAMTPVIITHRFFGRSIADLVMDIQRIKTALLRGALDNLYLHNNPRVEVAESFANESTLDDLLVSRPGGIVRTKTPGGLNWQTVPDITGSVYPALQYFDAVREWRTGVSRQGQGVDPNALQNQVATIANQMADAAQAKTRLIARIFAETGIRDLFSLLHGVIRKNGQQAETVRLRNKWVTVDPRDWKERNDMTINVGFGTGSKAQQLAHVMAIIGLQKEALAAGKTNLVSDANLYNSAREVTKLVGLKNVDEFFTDPASQPPPQPQQDPEIQKLQLEYQLKDREAQNKAAIEKTQAEADITTNQSKVQADIVRDDRKFQQEDARNQREHEMRMAEMRLKMAGTVLGHVTKAQQPAAGEDGQPVQQQALDIDGILSRIAPLMQGAPQQQRPRGMRIVRDAQGRVSHTEPME